MSLRSTIAFLVAASVAGCGGGGAAQSEALPTLTGWTTKSATPAHSAGWELEATATRLLLISRDGTQTMTSGDRGATWNAVSSAPTSASVSGVSTTSDGTSVFMARGGIVNDVWKFDGSSWQSRTEAAPYQNRIGQAMAVYGGALFVISGANPFGHQLPFGDVWKSADEGATWQQISQPFAGKGAVCAVQFQQQLTVITTDAAVFQSADGVSWNSRAAPADSPLRMVASHGPLGTPGNCTVGNGRIYVIDNGRVISSADLVHWAAEPQVPAVGTADMIGDIAAFGNRLYVVQATLSGSSASISVPLHESVP